MTKRVSDERLAKMCASAPKMLAVADSLGSSKDEWMLALDLRDTRSELARLGYAEDASRQLEIARERIAELERERDEWRLAAGAEAARRRELTAECAAMREALEKYGKHPDSCPKGAGIGFYKPPVDARCDCGIDRSLSGTAGAALLKVARAAVAQRVSEMDNAGGEQ